MLSSVAEDDSGMGHIHNNGDPVSQEFEQMQLQQTEAPNRGRIQREGSRALQRRSNVFSQAAEDGNNIRILEPSWQMISNSQAQDGAEDNIPGPSAGSKRKDHPMDMSLMPMPEDEEWSAANGPPLDECNGADGSRRKGKANNDTTQPADSRSVKGTRAKKADIGPSEDEPPQKVRRSSRQTPQKNARR
jgi:ser/thr/tyr protein kinase RAD53